MPIERCHTLRRWKPLLALAVTLLAPGARLFPQTPPLWGELTPGRFAVGFRTIDVIDRTRTFIPKTREGGLTAPAERARPVQVSFWYPALPSKHGGKMKFGAYVDLLAREGDPARGQGNRGEPGKELFVKSVRRWLGEIPSGTGVDELLNTETGATAEAVPAKGKFPLVLVAQGSSQSALTHSILCEYAASHGFVLVTVPSVGPMSREMPSEPRGAEGQARDLECASAAVREFLHAGAGEGTAIVGFSFGGFASLLEATRNPDVGALISLDSNLGFAGAAEFLSRCADFDAGGMRIPLLHFSQYEYPGLEEKFVDSLRYCDRTIIRVKGLTHFDFSSFGMIAAIVPGFVKGTRPEQREGYESVCRHVLAFLENVRDGKEAAAARDGADFAPGSRGLFTIRHLGADPAALRYEEFVDVIRARGIGEARALYTRGKQAAPGDTLFAEGTLNRLGYELLYAYGLTAEAIEVFRWNAESYPASFNVYDSLGEAYLASGNNDLAAANYRKSLSLNPQNAGARTVLDRIGRGTR